MKWFFFNSNRTTPLLKKLNKHSKRKTRSRDFYKYRSALATFLILVGWVWSLSYDKGNSLLGQLLMLGAALSLGKDLFYLFRADPVDEVINDLEQQFWDLEFKKDSDPHE